MKLLDAINKILPKLGEHPVTSTEAKTPTLGVIIPQIETEIDDVLMAGWWFNEFPVDLYPNSEGQIVVPVDTLSFVPDRRSGSVVQRGELFYNGDTRSYTFTGKISGKLIQRLDFEELPESAAAFVFKSALVTCYATDIGLESVVQLWQGQANAASALMDAEHLKHKKYSIKQSPRFINRRRAMGGY